MRFFKRQETRNQPYTDAVVDAIQTAATGSIADIQKSAALEIAASTISKAFSSLNVKSENQMVSECITPEILGQIGRQLIRRGESLHFIDVNMQGIQLIPIASWDVRGQYSPSSWTYRVDTFGPSSNTTRLINGSGVVHCRYATDPANPWLGISPLQWASRTSNIHSEGEVALEDEVRSPRGTLIPISKDGGSSTLEKLRNGLKTLRGSIALVPGNALLGESQGLVRREYELKRLGFNSPVTQVDLHSQTNMAILAACGIPIELVSKSGDSGQRESWRRFLFSTVQPLIKIVQSELSMKLETEIVLDTSELFASDLAGRARAFATMVTAGKSTDEAAQLTGLVSE